jgi:hypothetical protein
MDKVCIDYFKVIDWNTRIFTKVTYTEKDNLIQWLISHKYILVNYVELENADIRIYQAKNIDNSSLYAILFPDVAKLDTECLFINIPTEKEVYLLIDNVIEKVRPLIKEN